MISPSKIGGLIIGLYLSSSSYDCLSIIMVNLIHNKLLLVVNAVNLYLLVVRLILNVIVFWYGEHLYVHFSLSIHSRYGLKQKVVKSVGIFFYCFVF